MRGLCFTCNTPVRLPFLDFATLASRLRYCELEVALNQRTAPALYIDVVPIVESEGRFVAGGHSEYVEWSVRMRQFPPESLLSRMIERGTLTARHVDLLAGRVAGFHQSIGGRGPGTACGTPREALRLALDNFDQLEPLTDQPA